MRRSRTGTGASISPATSSKEVKIPGMDHLTNQEGGSESVQQGSKVTYATLRNDNQELHDAYDAALARVRRGLGRHHMNFVAGRERDASSTFEKRSPIDGAVVGTFAAASRSDVRDALKAARAAFPAWASLDWRHRCEVLRRAADAISEMQMDLAALLSIEVGKNRLEAIGDVEETADLIRWSCDLLETNRGFDREMGNLGDPHVRTRSVLKPYGVWAVISPFNFPFALAGGPIGAALAAGNTVVFKPSSEAPLAGVGMANALRESGLPDGVFNLVMGPGETVGGELQGNEAVDGLVFTGSFEVGFQLYRTFPQPYPKPVIIEMGGKNPVIVSRHADLDAAAEGVMRSAFGLSGQKCSAASRIYVEREVHDEFIRLLAAKTESITVGDPTDRSVWMGPVINSEAVARYEAALGEALKAGRVVTGGRRLQGPVRDAGFFVAPTVVADLPAESRLLRDELFLPFVAVVGVDSVGAGLTRANENILGLTAGFYSEREEEVRTFLEVIEAGVVYVNRRAGATTGAWPGVQPFGGWKGSGATGKSSGGPYYIQQFMREQSQTIVE